MMSKTPKQKPPLRLADLAAWSLADLKAEYVRLYGETTNSGNRRWLERRIAWRLQALAEGDLSLRAKQRAAEIAADADLRTTLPPEPPPAAGRVLAFQADRRLPPPGSLLVRDYKGQRVEALVVKGGFEWQGQRFSTLSALAKAITGSHLNGYAFFGLTKEVSR